VLTVAGSVVLSSQVKLKKVMLGAAPMACGLLADSQ
jgi:hypothetical protein